jgi:hypothetical protein
MPLECSRFRRVRKPDVPLSFVDGEPIMPVAGARLELPAESELSRAPRKTSKARVPLRGADRLLRVHADGRTG